MSVGKNSSFLRVVYCRSLADEYSVDAVNKDEISKFEKRFLSDFCSGLFIIHFFVIERLWLSFHPLEYLGHIYFFTTFTISACVFSASCMDNPDSEMVFYLMLRVIDRFYQQHSRYPGMTKTEITKKKKPCCSFEEISVI